MKLAAAVNLAWDLLATATQDMLGLLV
jgi:hypothetical protein